MSIKNTYSAIMMYISTNFTIVYQEPGLRVLELH